MRNMFSVVATAAMFGLKVGRRVGPHYEGGADRAVYTGDG